MASFVHALGGSRHSVDLPIDAGAVTRCAREPRAFSYTGARPSDWQQQYYMMFIQHGASRELCGDLLRRLRALGGDTVAHAIAFVQEGIAYDHARAGSPMSDGLRYPLETLAMGRGLCADKSLLLARLLLDLGLGVALFVFDRANHMAVGLMAPGGQGAYGSPYAYIETTGPTMPGQIPERMAGGVRLDGRPTVAVLGGSGAWGALSGLKEQADADTKAFGKEYLSMPAEKQGLFREMKALEERMEALKPQVRKCQGTLPADRYHACQPILQEYNGLVAAYNALVARFNAR